MKCKKCLEDFTQKKSFHKYCDICIKTAARCGTCMQIVFAHDGRLRCCGFDEPIPEISRLSGRSLEDMIFILQHNRTPEQAYADHFGQDALDDLMPNR